MTVRVRTVDNHFLFLSAVLAHEAYLYYMLRAHARMIRASKYLSTVRNFQWLWLANWLTTASFSRIIRLSIKRRCIICARSITYPCACREYKGNKEITIFPFLSAVRAHGVSVSVVIDVVSDWTAVWIYDPKLHYAAYGCRNRSTRDKVSFYQWVFI